jgi:hypothetical protein
VVGLVGSFIGSLVGLVGLVGLLGLVGLVRLVGRSFDKKMLYNNYQ